MLRILTAALALTLLFPSGVTTPEVKHRDARSVAIDSYLNPYIASQNFAGSVLVTQGKTVIYEKSFGYADREAKIPNGADTRFHVASMSMQFTAGAILRLVDKGALHMDTQVAEIVPGINGGDRITIRNLLEQRSGLTDINTMPDYNDILGSHQTPATLVARIAKEPLLFEPGTKYLHEEHSAYNLLALIVERVTGKAFSAAVRDLVFAPAGLRSAGADDDSIADTREIAKGYQPLGVREIEPVTPIHWSGKAGNASVYLSARDEARWVDSLFYSGFLSGASRRAVADSIPRIGFGWFRGTSRRFAVPSYYMNGRAPGFSSYVLHLPDNALTVVVLSNIYSSATTDIGNDVAAIALGAPYRALVLPAQLLSADSIGVDGATFNFGADFYQPNAKLRFLAKSGELFLEWPGGSLSPMIPLDRDHLIDRAYWVTAILERDSVGKPVALVYDRFRGLKDGDAPRAVLKEEKEKE